MASREQHNSGGGNGNNGGGNGGGGGGHGFDFPSSGFGSGGRGHHQGQRGFMKPQVRLLTRSTSCQAHINHQLQGSAWYFAFFGSNL